MRLLLAACLLALPLIARGADPVPFLPAETDAVLTIQARQLAESELGKKVGADLLKELLDVIKPAAAAVNATGLDPARDFDLITVGLTFNKATAARPFALFEGKFDRKAVETSVTNYMKEHPGHVSAVTVGDKPVYKVGAGKPNDAMYAAIVDDTRIVIAPNEKDLSGAFAAAAGSRKPVISKELAALLATTKPTAPVFLRAWVKGKFNDLNLPNDKLKAAVQGVDWATAAIAVTRDVAMTVTLNAPDPASAQKLTDLLSGVIGLVRLQLMAAAEDQPELRPIADLLKATKVAANGRTVVAAGMVKGEAIEKALATPPPTKNPAEPKTVPVPKKK
jgi:hypothetical protein